MANFVLHLLHWNNTRGTSHRGQWTITACIWACLVCNYFFSVFRNGDLLCPPFRFIIPRSMRQDLEQILSLVTEKVSLRTGAVRRSVTQTVTYEQREIQRVKEKPCASSGCALWGERPCPQLLSWRPNNTMLPWEPRDSRNFHMWSCWSQKLQRGIVVIGPLWSVLDVLLSLSHMTEDEQTFSWFFYFPYFVDITQAREGR